ncbi:hypothetical protein MBRA1_002391 [Malassezia brasiliensis]|uniref:FHF complex subunit HOOK-interacting protein C-terminal domain-containing protein n=1 Tax=Malassezia brasiliensis TaxID=1821822 RepID=A0AAF0DUS4_9BASI|nr:hypothetical protein MBRA1_002391 [Malassezia brasiliensis]
MSFWGSLLSARAAPAPSASGASAARDAGLLASAHEQWDTIRSFLASPDRRAMQGGVDDTGIPACMDQLVHVLLTEDRLSKDATLGACMEFVFEQDVFEGLLGLCLADEPRGVKRAMIAMFGKLVGGMRPAFLAHQGVLRVLAQLLHHSIHTDPTAEGDGTTEALLDLVCELATHLGTQPSVLRLLVELGAAHAAAQPRDAFPVFAYLLQHLHHPGARGFRVRTAALAFLQGLLDADAGLLSVVSHSRLAESLSTATAASYGLLPMRLDAAASESAQRVCDAERAQQWRSVVEAWVDVAFVPELCTFLDLVWLTQATMHACASHPRTEAPCIDQLEQLRADILDHFRSTFLESVVHPSIAGCSLSEGSGPAVLLYSALLFIMLDPRGALSQVACTAQGERPLNEVITECIAADDAPLPVRVLGLRVAALYARRRQLHDVTRGAEVQRPAPPSATPILAALIHTLHTPRTPVGLDDRYTLHLVETERCMRMDPDYRFADCIVPAADGVELRHAILRQPMDPHDHILITLLTQLCSLLVQPLVLNIEVTRALASLCRSPFVSLDDVLYASHGETPPLLLSVLVRLTQQVRLCIERVPDFGFYLAQRRNQQWHLTKTTAATIGAHSPLAEAYADSKALGSLQDTLDDLSPLPPTVYDLQLELDTPTLPPTSHVRPGPVRNSAKHLVMHIAPCSVLGLTPATASPCRRPLLHVLDSILLLDEFLVELAALLQLRVAWDVDPS